MTDPKVFRLGARGLARVLGPLEARILEVLWDHDEEMTVQGICDALDPRSNYKTVMTVLGRLTCKGLLERRRRGKAYLYRPRTSRQEFARSVADGVVQGLLRDYGEVAVASFVDALDRLSPEALETLERLARKRRARDRMAEEER